NGPHSHHAVFLGYPEGTKGYRLRNQGTGAFFTARDVIFDEALPSITHTCDSDSEDDDTSVISMPSASTPATQPPASTTSLSTSPVAPRRSAHVKVPTPAGQAFAEELAATKTRLLALREARCRDLILSSLTMAQFAM
ncbi:hypothetical protein CY34DRAFT_100219, partial [Suillus luteus UH-Slu-Lm8-n1]